MTVPRPTPEVALKVALQMSSSMKGGRSDEGSGGAPIAELARLRRRLQLNSLFTGEKLTTSFFKIV